MKIGTRLRRMADEADEKDREILRLRRALRVYADRKSWELGSNHETDAWAWAGPGSDYLDERGAPWTLAQAALRADEEGGHGQ